MNGFLNLNKPAGLTSHDCVSRVRRRLRMKRVGHGGTLDPAATGVLPIAVGRATRLLAFLPPHKAYRARVRFGVRTTTDDLEGDVIASRAAAALDLDGVTPHLGSFQGTVQQIPPKYSAIQVGGKRLYELARAGEAVDVPVRTVEVYAIEVLGWTPGDFPELEVAIACGSGTYIRAIARDLGEQVGTGGTLAALERTRSGGFDVADSLTLEDVSAEALISPAIALSHLAEVELTPEQAVDWGHGRPVTIAPDGSDALDAEESNGEESDYVRVAAGERFLGVAQRVGDDGGVRLAPKVVWPTSP